MHWDIANAMQLSSCVLEPVIFLKGNIYSDKGMSMAGNEKVEDRIIPPLCVVILRQLLPLFVLIHHILHYISGQITQ